jgi:hypothetical protein
MTEHLRDEDLLDPPASGSAHLAACTACSARRDAHAAVRARLRELSREAEVSPAALALFETKRTRRYRRAIVAVVVVAACLVTFLSLVIARALRRPPIAADLADELALDHLHYAHRGDAAEVRGDAATIASYFGERLGFSPHYGPIEAATFEGAKPCRIAGKWTALAWLDRAGHWLSLFTMPEHDVRARGCTSVEGVRVCGAPDPRGGARVLVGDLSEPEMLRLIDDSLR